MRNLIRISLAVFALALAPSAAAAVFAYPSSQTIPASGRLPQGGTPVIAMNAAIGEREGAWIVATGAKEVSAAVDYSALGPLKAAVYFGHFVSFDGRDVPDALLPWSGAARPTEKPNQPLYLQVVVPPDAAPGGYRMFDSLALEVSGNICVATLI